jgi:hypothetical protein
MWKFTPGTWGPLLTSPLGANFTPRGEFVLQGWIVSSGGEVVLWGWSYPLGVKFSVCPSILLNSRECSPLGVNEGVNIPPRGEHSPRGQISPQGAKLTPGDRGEVMNGPLICVWSGPSSPHKKAAYVCHRFSKWNSSDRRLATKINKLIKRTFTPRGDALLDGRSKERGFASPLGANFNPPPGTGVRRKKRAFVKTQKHVRNWQRPMEDLLGRRPGLRVHDATLGPKVANVNKWPLSIGPTKRKTAITTLLFQCWGKYYGHELQRQHCKILQHNE